MIFIVVAVVVMVLDRITKSIVNATIPYGTEVPVLGHLVGITNIRNSGAAFGFAPVGPWVFLAASLVVGELALALVLLAGAGLTVFFLNQNFPSTDTVLGNPALHLLGGWVGLLCGGLAMYGSFALVTNATYGREVIPVGNR